MASNEYNIEDLGRVLRKYLRPILIGLIAVILLFGTFFQVGAEEVGVITRFGQYVRNVEPGLNVKIPFVEKVVKVPVERQLKQEFGYHQSGRALPVCQRQHQPGRIVYADR